MTLSAAGPTTMTFSPRSAFLTLTLLLVTLTPVTLALETLLTFRDPEGHPFQELVVDGFTGSVYVGATNRLHRLSPGLTLMQSAATGPREDNPDCPPPLLPCAEPKALTDAVTKGLAVDPSDKTLILCTTLHHGSCQKLSLSNITSVVHLANTPLVPNEASASSVLFIGPGLENNKQALYVGAEYSSLGSTAFRDLVPSVSSRKLSDLTLSYRDQEGDSKKSIKEDLRSSFRVKYVHGFALGDFAYFLTVQKESLTSDKLVSRIARVCTRDRYFRSYVEIPLVCQGKSLTQYHVLQGVDVDEDSRKVYAVFGEADQASWQEGKSSSVLCVLDVDVADVEFNRTVKECYEGQGRVGPPHYEATRTCMPT
ncbi:plexin-A4-like, partial [Littorina saxatilis]|uniref:plexin-A4-like n=1 Tax=Littorina saxatilis TaxID=31220 RepID=UPI0038B6A2D0